LAPVLLRMESRGARNLARVAYRVLVGRRIPVIGLPFSGVWLALRCAYQYSHVFRVERMPMRPAVTPPEMVIVNLRSRESVT